MKSTKIMLAVIAALLSTWTTFSLIGWVLSDTPLRECYTHGATLLLMLVIGWIPAVVIGADLEEQFKDS